nr:carbohydrate-binding family 9-like protein [Bacteroides sp. 214]
MFYLGSDAASAENANDMKKMIVKKVSVNTVKPEELSSLMDREQIETHAINTVNWKQFSYCPVVNFRIAYTDSAILLNYKVTENSVRARYGEYNGKVWTDSCVEFFVVPGGDDVYYNLECNCIGTLLLGGGAGRSNRQRATSETLDTIGRWSSLGSETFEERVEETSWEVSLVIPFSAFFMHKLTSLAGQTIRANFYKCGDELVTPHYLSWNPILLEKPNFHRPDFFGTLLFE